LRQRERFLTEQEVLGMATAFCASVPRSLRWIFPSPFPKPFFGCQAFLVPLRSVCMEWRERAFSDSYLPFFFEIACKLNFPCHLIPVARPHFFGEPPRGTCFQHKSPSARISQSTELSEISFPPAAPSPSSVFQEPSFSRGSPFLNQADIFSSSPRRKKTLLRLGPFFFPDLSPPPYHPLLSPPPPPSSPRTQLGSADAPMLTQPFFFKCFFFSFPPPPPRPRRRFP